MLIQLTYYYLIVLVFLFICLAIGSLFHKLIKDKQELSFAIPSIFQHIVLGLTIIVCLYSIIITRGKTVSWMYLLVICAYGYFNRTGTKELIPGLKSKDLFKVGEALFIVSLSFFFIYLFAIFDFKAFAFTRIHCDWPFYTETSQYLNLGYESTQHFDNTVFGGSFTPYHYFEIWISAVISFLFHTPMEIATSVITPTILGCVSYIGVLSLTTNLNLNKFVLSFLILFISIVYYFNTSLAFFGINLPFISGGTTSVVTYPKLYSILIFILLSLSFTLKKQFIIGLICILFIPVATFVTAPSLIPGVWILICSVIIFGKAKWTVNFRQNSRFIIFLTIYSVALACYYFFFWDKNPSDSYISTQSIGDRLFTVGKPLIHILETAPFLLYLFLRRKDAIIESRLQKIYVGFYAITIILAIAVVLLTTGFFDSFQFFSNLYIPITTSLCAVFIIRQKERLTKSVSIMNALLVFLLLSSMFYTTKFLYQQCNEKQSPACNKAVIEELDKTGRNNTINCGFIHSKTFYSNFRTCFISRLFMAGEMIDCYRNNFYQVGLSDYTALNCLYQDYKGESLAKNQGFAIIKQGTFYKYVEQQKKNKTFISIGNSQIKFIHQFNISYIYIQNNADIPRLLKPLIKLVTTEKEQTGYSFYKIIN